MQRRSLGQSHNLKPSSGRSTRRDEIAWWGSTGRPVVYNNLSFTITWLQPRSPLSMGTMIAGCALPLRPILIVGAAPSPNEPAVFVM